MRRCTPSSKFPRQSIAAGAVCGQAVAGRGIAPCVASRHLVRNNVDYLPPAELEGRVATTLWVVYPPGIATIVPGERLTERARPIIDYLKMFEKSANVFPGFEAEV